MRKSFCTLLVVFLSGSCSPVQRPVQYVPKSPAVVTVNVVGACPVRSVVGATVELRSSDGQVVARTLTGSDGAAAFSQAVFGRANLVIVCHSDYFCGVLELHGHRGASFFIALAPAMVSSKRVDGKLYEFGGLWHVKKGDKILVRYIPK